MTNKEKFLINNIGFHFDDLSLAKQMELEAITEELGLTREWVLLALSKQGLEEWEKWGFVLFRKPEFRTQINNLLKAFNKLDDEKIKKEFRKQKKDKRVVSVKLEDFKRIYNSVMAQGQLLNQLEAQAAGLDSYWTYSYLLNDEGKKEIDDVIAQGLKWDEYSEDEWVSFVLSVQHVKIY